MIKKFGCLLMVTFSLCLSLSANAETGKVVDGLESSEIRAYIRAKTYPQININDDFGQLTSESYVGNYKIASLHEFYRNKICKGVFWFNCKYNINSLNQYAGINLAEESGLVGHPFSQINAYKVVYTSPDLAGNSQQLSGAILIPQSSQPLKGVVIFYHYTVLNKENIPSNFDKDEYQLTKLVASSLASDGYVVVLPDYQGFGVDTKKVHPYIVYPEVNALSGIYMLKLISSVQPGLRYRLIEDKVPLMISGYSEGASYALWAAKILQDNPEFLANYGYRLTMTVPVDGAYNLSQVTLPFMLKNTNEEHTPPYFIENQRISGFSRPGLIANVLHSYAAYTLKGQDNLAFSPEFYRCDDCEVDDKPTNVSGLLEESGTEYGKFNALYKAAKETGYDYKKDSIQPLAAPNFANNLQFQQQLFAADIYNWQALTPISFLTLQYDSTVPRLNSETAYLAMQEQGSRSLNITLVPNQNFKVKSYIPFSDMDVDHPQGINFLIMFVRQIFDEGLADAANN